MQRAEFKPAKEMDLQELEEFLKSTALPSQPARPSNPARSDSPSLPVASSGNLTNLQSLQAECTKLQEQLKFLQEQCDFARNETKRVQDQHSIDRENWALEVQHLKKLLLKRPGEASSKPEVKKLMQANKDLQAKNDQQRSELLQARTEFDLMKAAKHKKILALQGELARLKKREGEALKKTD